MLGLLMIMLLRGAAADGECPFGSLKLSPEKLVVQHGDAVGVNCSTEDLHEGIEWKATEESTGMQTDQFVMWLVDSLSNWDPQAQCNMQFNETIQCSKNLTLIVYKPPDRVSISLLNHTGPMVEGTEYQLQCDVLNVAPLQNLTVIWYKGNVTIKTDSYSDQIKTPVNKSSILTITPNRTDDGAQYRCEAQLNLGPDGPQPSIFSSDYNLTVFYAPVFLQGEDTVELSEGSNETLVCSAEGNPPPKLEWTSDNAENIDVTTEGRLSKLYVKGVRAAKSTVICNATNGVGSWQISVILKSTLTSTTPSTSAETTLTSAVTKVTPNLELTPPRVVVRHGGSVSAKCSTTSTDHDVMGWEASQGNTSSTPNVTMIIWAVENLTDWHTEPKCFITPTDGEQHLVSLPITLYKPPDRVSISLFNHTGPMVEGTEYQLQCDVLNVAPVQNLTVIWYKGNVTIKTDSYSDQIKTPLNKSSILTITPSRVDDGAQYRCEAQLNLGPEGPQPSNFSSDYNLTVFYKPVIRRCPSQFTGVEHKFSLSMDICVADGNPRPHVKWHLKGKVVNASMILSRRNSGEYVLMASNGLGSVNSTVNINVEYAPELICPIHYEGKEGKKHNLNCTAEGIPTPTVIWRKYGKELDLPMIMTRNDRGNYTVSANNKHGTAKKEVDVDILYAPEFLPGEDTVELSEGSDETLVCSANGNPPPKLKWTDVNALNVHVTTEGRQSTIRITGATSTNTGSYNCTATNSVGTVTRTTTVRMKDPPSVMVYLLVLSALVFFIIIIIVVILRYCIKRRGSYQFTPIPQGTGSLGTPLIPLSQTSNGTS